MLSHSNVPFPVDVVGVLAHYFADGNGPTGTTIASTVAAAGIDVGARDYPNKQARVRHAFEVAEADQSYRLAEDLLGLLRNDGAFGPQPDRVEWAKRARAAFLRVGWQIDEDGYPDWVPLARPTRRSIVDNMAAAIQVVADASATLIGPDVTDEAVGTRLPSWGDDGAVANPVRPWAGSSVPAAVAGPTNPPIPVEPEEPKKIFLVHGHDAGARFEVESFVSRTTGITPTVLMLEASGGKTVIEKFEAHADKASYAIVLMTADDVGQSKADRDGDQAPVPRARQNVVFEFGYFVGYLRRSHVAALVAPGVERPSDIAGVVYVDFVSGGADWQMQLRREMRQAQIPIID